VTPSDSELIARTLIYDDRAAFGELVRRYQSAVRRFLRHLAGDAAAADDLAQETFLQAYRGLVRFRGDSSFSSWLLGIAHNHFRNARRRHRETVVEAAETDTAVPDSTRASDLREDLSIALEKLEPDEQTALHLFYQQGLTQSEVAVALGWPLGTVKTHLARGKDKLRILLHLWNPQT
jgi:RNA polymerase sigma factor (sigma-70 family)